MYADSSKSIQLHPEFLAAVQDQETYEAAVACAKGQGWPTSTVVNASVDSIIKSIAQGRAPSILVIDIDGIADYNDAIARLVSAVGDKSQILCIGVANDINSYRAVLQAGAADYLVKPLNSVILRDAILPLLSARDKKRTDKKNSMGKFYAIVGVRGGVGATTIAVNTAWIIAHEMNQRAALIDLDLQFGNCDLALDLDPARGLREVLTSPDRMDNLLINSSLSRESDNLAIFCAEESIEEVIDFDTNGPLALIKTLRTEYDHIVVDVPRTLISRHRRLLATADEIIIVTDLTLSGIRDTQRIVSAIQNLGTDIKVHVVAGRIGDGESQIGVTTFERGAKVKIEALLPHDTRTIKLAANKGKPVPVVGAAAPLAKALRHVASLMTGQKINTAPSAGFLSSLFQKKG